MSVKPEWFVHLLLGLHCDLVKMTQPSGLGWWGILKNQTSIQYSVKGCNYIQEEEGRHHVPVEATGCVFNNQQYHVLFFVECSLLKLNFFVVTMIASSVRFRCILIEMKLYS